MALRIHDFVIRGEIDNTERGCVKGKLWLHGEDQPYVLRITGNAHADLAGCRMEFTNPEKPMRMRRDLNFAHTQEGTAGDITASRKVRVMDLPMAEWMEAKRAGKPAPEHWANCLYIEWYSATNGRVVIEIPEAKVKVSPPEWQMSADEESQRAAAAEQGFADFLGKLSEAVDKAKAEVPDAEDEWDEFDHEKFMRESDARTDKYMELIEKYGESDEAEAIIAREMGWSTGDDDEGTEGEFSAGDDDAKGGWEIPDINDLNDLPDPELDPSTEGIDWVRDEAGHVCHPLQKRSFEAAVALWKAVDELGIDDDHPDMDDISEMTFKFQQTSAKLAGALDSLGYDGRRHGDMLGATIARLKRALGILHECQAAMTRVKEKATVPADIIAPAESELFAIREEMLRLMAEFRQG